MGKFLLGVSLSILIFLSVGTAVVPNSPAFWLASGDLGLQIVRAVLAFVLLVQLSTNPPRKVAFRRFAGVVSLSVLIWSATASYNFAIPILDTFAFWASSIAILATALERKKQIVYSVALGNMSRRQHQTN